MGVGISTYKILLADVLTRSDRELSRSRRVCDFDGVFVDSVTFDDSFWVSSSVVSNSSFLAEPVSASPYSSVDSSDESSVDSSDVFESDPSPNSFF